MRILPRRRRGEPLPQIRHLTIKSGGQLALSELPEGLILFAFLQDPNVAELKGIAVPLQLYRPRGAFGIPSASARFSIDFKLIMDFYTVVPDGDDRILNFPVALADGVRELDVIRLPLKRGKTHVHAWSRFGIEAAAFVIESLQAEGIQNLKFVVVHLVKPTVAATLPTGIRTKRQHEFEVHGVVLKAVFGADVIAVGIE